MGQTTRIVVTAVDGTGLGPLAIGRGLLAVDRGLFAAALAQRVSG